MINLLEVKHVTKKFGGVVANNDVSFSVERGQIVGLIGPNGAGKSTMFNMVSCVFPPTSGEIVFEGRNIENISSFKAASLGIARTFQNLQVFKNMTVIENVMVGAHLHTRSNMLIAALSLPGKRKEERELYDMAMEYLHFVGLEHLFDYLSSDLPLGALRLLELARALAVKPKLLLLDEIAAGLNHKETKEMANLIEHIRDRGVTVLVVEHDMDLVMGICDKVVVLDQGVKIAEGTPKEVQNNEQVINAYLGADIDDIKGGE